MYLNTEIYIGHGPKNPAIVLNFDIKLSNYRRVIQRHQTTKITPLITLVKIPKLDKLLSLSNIKLLAEL